MAEGSSTTAISDSNLPLQRIWHWEKERAHDVYLTQPMGGGTMRDYTWLQAVGEARRVAAYLKGLNLPAGSNIAILSKNCAHWIMSDFAIWMAGHVSVPLYPTLSAETVRQILDHSQCKAIFIGKLDEWEQMKAGVPSDIHRIAYPLSPPAATTLAKVTWDEIVAKTAPLQGTPLRPADELATIIYTSGTTGMPKGVMHAFRSFAGAPEAIRAGFGLRPDDRMISYLPLSHVAERWCVEACSIAAGFRVFFADSLDTFAADLRRARPTFFISVPRLWTKFQQGVFAKMPKEKLELVFKVPVLGRLMKKKILAGLGLDQCRFAGGGAAPMPPALLSWFNELGLELLEGYGMTENFGCSHGSFPGKGRVGYVGSNWPGSESRLSESGEVLTRSPWTMLGYYKEPEKTKESFTDDGWLRTGDLGEFDAQGRLRITGRAKELFKTSKGKYVAPAPIESKLSTHPKIEAVCVMGANQGQPCAVAMLSPEALRDVADAGKREQLAQSLKAHLEKINPTLDPHEQLDFIAVATETWNVENGFLTPSMKIKRNKIEDAYGKYLDGWYGKRQPVVWQ